MSSKWKLLEWYVAEHFRREGWHVYPRTFDEVGTWKVKGILTSEQVDVFGWKEDKYGKEYLLVECKLYSNNRKVGKKEIQKFIQSIENLKLRIGRYKAFFVTTSDFTKSAIKIAQGYGIILINGEKLKKILGYHRWNKIIDSKKVILKAEKNKFQTEERFPKKIRVIINIHKIKPRKPEIINSIIENIHYDSSLVKMEIGDILLSKKLINLGKRIKFTGSISRRKINGVLLQKTNNIHSSRFFEFRKESKIKEGELTKDIKEKILNYVRGHLIKKIFNDEINGLRKEIQKKYSGDQEILMKELQALGRKLRKIEEQKRRVERDIKSLEYEIDRRIWENRPTKRLKEKLKKTRKIYREIQRQYESVVKRISRVELKMQKLEKAMDKEITERINKYLDERLREMVITEITIEDTYFELANRIDIKINAFNSSKANKIILSANVSKGNIIFRDYWICSYCLRLFKDIDRCSKCKTFVCDDCAKTIRKFLILKRKLCPRCYREHTKR